MIFLTMFEGEVYHCLKSSRCTSLGLPVLETARAPRKLIRAKLKCPLLNDYVIPNLLYILGSYFWFISLANYYIFCLQVCIRLGTSLGGANVSLQYSSMDASLSFYDVLSYRAGGFFRKSNCPSNLPVFVKEQSISYSPSQLLLYQILIYSFEGSTDSAVFVLVDCFFIGLLTSCFEGFRGMFGRRLERFCLPYTFSLISYLELMMALLGFQIEELFLSFSFSFDRDDIKSFSFYFCFSFSFESWGSFSFSLDLSTTFYLGFSKDKRTLSYFFSLSLEIGSFASLYLMLVLFFLWVFYFQFLTSSYLILLFDLGSFFFILSLSFPLCTLYCLMPTSFTTTPLFFTNFSITEWK